MKSIAIYPVEFVILKSFGMGYVPTNVGKFRWPEPLTGVVSLTADEASQRYEDHTKTRIRW